MSLIPMAHAAESATAAHGGSSIMQFVPMIIIFILFWFLLIRPQQKKAKLQNQMLANLQKGDEVVTSSGILGTVSKVVEQFVQIEIADNVVITVQKSTIAGKLEKGTLAKSRN